MKNDDMTVEKLLTTKEVAEWLRVSLTTLHKWRKEQAGPPAVQLGNRLRYRRAEVEAWLDEHVEVQE